MKKNAIKLSLVLVSVAAVATIRGGPLHLAHEPLQFEKASSKYALVIVDKLGNKAGSVTVERTALPMKRGDALQKHRLVIHKNSKKKATLSLLTLGLQTPHMDMRILSGTAGAKFAPIHSAGPDADQDIPANGLPIPMTGFKPSGGQPDDSKVWFVSFSGKKCVLEFHIEPTRDWSTIWWEENAAPREGHGVEPPY